MNFSILGDKIWNDYLFEAVSLFGPFQFSNIHQYLLKKINKYDKNNSLTEKMEFLKNEQITRCFLENFLHFLFKVSYRRNKKFSEKDNRVINFSECFDFYVEKAVQKEIALMDHSNESFYPLNSIYITVSSKFHFISGDIVVNLRVNPSFNFLSNSSSSFFHPPFLYVAVSFQFCSNFVRLVKIDNPFLSKGRTSSINVPCPGS